MLLSVCACFCCISNHVGVRVYHVLIIMCVRAVGLGRRRDIFEVSTRVHIHYSPKN